MPDEPAAMHTSSLGSLTDPHSPMAPLDVAGGDAKVLRDQIAMMLRIRIVEEEIADLAQSGEIKTPIHLGIGQEAVAVGVSAHLRRTDRIFGGHRSHSHYLALGGDLDRMVAEIMCRRTGAAGGRGGSMHLIDREAGFSGSVPLVGATVPLAVGAAHAAKMDGNGDVAVAYFGDGACEEGVVHESLNLAAVLQAPVLFVVENNLYSSHLDINLRQPDDRTARFAEAHRVPAATVDGNDAIAVAAAAGEMISNMREGGGPGFLEAVTYRWRGHVGPDENIDVGLKRSIEEIKAWKGRDPVARLRDAMLAADMLSDGDFETIESEERARIAASIAKAMAADFPAPETVLDHVYAS